MTATSALVWITMNPTVPSTADGDLAIMWRRFAVATIVERAEAAADLGMPIDPRPLPDRCRPFRRMVVAAVVVVAVAAAVVVAVYAVKLFATECALFGIAPLLLLICA